MPRPPDADKAVSLVKGVAAVPRPPARRHPLRPGGARAPLRPVLVDTCVLSP